MNNNKGFTLTELLCTIALIGIMSAIALPIFMKIIGNVRVSMAINQLTLHGGKARYDAIGDKPKTLCVTNIANGIKFANISGTGCDQVTQWQTIGGNVQVDLANSTLRSVAGFAGNSAADDRIYRLSFADTRAGYGGSYGQLGKLVVFHPWTDKRKCLVLSHVDGRNDIREGRRCMRR